MGQGWELGERTLGCPTLGNGLPQHNHPWGPREGLMGSLTSTAARTLTQSPFPVTGEGSGNKYRAGGEPGGFQGRLPPRTLGEKGMGENAPKIHVRSALSRSIALLHSPQ